MRGIIPRKIKGFRDLEPDIIRLRWHIINTASKVYQAYGFEHWDTPALEYADCLGKYLPESNSVAEGVYSFQNPEKEPVLKPDGKELRDEQDLVVMENHFLTMRYDLTAPLARVYSEQLWTRHMRGQLQEGKAPLFRRFQYGPVFRFEHKLDPGRFREFWQLDFDTVGTDDVSVDAEACMILSESMETIGLSRGSYIVKANNRKVLQGFLVSLGVSKVEAVQDILRIIDKVDKIGIPGMAEELGDGRIDDMSGAKIPGLGLNIEMVNRIVQFLERFAETGKRHEVLEKLLNTSDKNPFTTEGLEELEQMESVLANAGFAEDRVIFSPTLVRGMAYYTGPVFEVESTKTFKDAKGRTRQVGSICGGGRYDNLVENLLGINVPASGASIGVDRLAELLLLTGQLPQDLTANGPVLIVAFDRQLMPEYQKIARELRDNGVPSEVYYGFQRGLKKQLSYADKKNCPIALMLGEDEFNKGVVTVRDLHLGKKMSAHIENKDEWKQKAQFEVPRGELIQKITGMIAGQ